LGPIRCARFRQDVGPNPVSDADDPAYRTKLTVLSHCADAQLSGFEDKCAQMSYLTFNQVTE
jgi:hypothetical protein